MTTKTAAVAAPAATGRDPLSARMRMLLVAIVLGGLANLANLAFGYNEQDTVAWFAAHKSAWAFATFGTAFNAMALIALLLAVCYLVRDRGARWATASLAIGAIGTFLYAVSALGAISAQSLATQTIVPPATASALLDYAIRHDAVGAAAGFPGFLLLLVAQVTITVALFRSRAVPPWVPITFVVGFVLETALAGNGGATTPLWIPQVVAEVAIGWYALRKASAAAPAAVPAG